ncbi:MAG TPA: STAS domain-containing protein, partial [Solirubrobacteraceae bacterium]
MTESTSRSSSENQDGAPFAIRGIESAPGRIRVEVRGELDIATSPRLNASLLRELLAGRDVELDLSRVTFMDACALGTIIGARKRFELRRQEFFLSLKASSQPHRLLT